MLCGMEFNGVTAFASEDMADDIKVVTTVTNEMEYVEYLKTMLTLTDEELSSRGFTASQIEEMREYDYNADLMKLKKRDLKELQAMGYSLEQIEKIQEYNGQDNAVEYISTYKLSNATLNGVHWVKSIKDANTVAIKYRFTWNQAPIFCATDSIALAWVGCDRGSYELLVEVIKENHTVYHHDMSSNKLLKKAKPDVSGDFNTRTIEFQMQSSQGEAEYYTKKIEGEIRIRTLANSYNLEQVLVRAAYGHTVLGTKPGSISVSTDGISPSIELAWNQEDLYNECDSFPAYEIKECSE